VGTYYPLEESLNEFYDTTKKLVITYLVILFFGLAGIRFAYLKQKKSAEKQKRLEAILQQSQKMEALGTMAGGIAHDFNNILAIILGNADIAQDDIPVGNPAKESIGQVLIAATRAKDLVKQILSFSRQDQSEKEPLYLCRLIEENMKSLRSVIPTSVKLKTNITAKCRDNSADCLMVHIDSTQIYQVFLNLCINAVQAMDEKGVLEISLDEITFEDKIPVNRLGLQPGTYEYLSVSDTGPGISPKIVQNIFDPFFTTKEVGKGTGMGLSVVHGIIEEHGGKIFVESEPGKGATFHIYFPAIEIEREEETEEVEPLLTGKERILLVDDDEMLAAMGKGMLERILGYSVTAKTDSSEALDLFQKNPSEFDLVITDQTMPNITGIELSVKLLAIRPNLPIILCTGYSSTVDRAKARQVGISEFVSKPFNKYEIAKLLRQVLDEEQQTTSFVLGECEP
jgi:signal transduction histidine kinase/CheY-like chemotaxis protein